LRRSTANVFRPEHYQEAVCPWGPRWTLAGVAEVLEPMVLPRRAARIRRVLESRLDSICLVLDAPHDPHNGAAVLRTCDALGVQALHVIERIEPFVVADSVSLGTERWVDVIAHRSAESAVQALRTQAMTLAIADPTGDRLPRELAQVERLALVLGNEKDGVCETLKAAADLTVRIPMRGFVESLNVSVSAALLLSSAAEGRPGDLKPDRYRWLYARALYRSVPRSGQVLANLEPR